MVLPPENGIPQGVYSKGHQLEGRRMVNANGDEFVIQKVMRSDEFKPLRSILSLGTYEHAITFIDSNGEKRWGPIPPWASPEQIEAELAKHGYKLKPPDPTESNS